MSEAASASGAMGIQIEVVAGYPVNDEMERVLGPAEAVGEPVTVTFMWEGRATRRNVPCWCPRPR